MSKQTAIRLADETLERLDAIAAKTGRTKAYYIREAIETHLEDLEDFYLAERAMKQIASGESKVISSEEFWRGLDD
jgi:RHH-type transcriptional regulator, rel operon repressor / antitoxin RelB